MSGVTLQKTKTWAMEPPAQTQRLGHGARPPTAQLHIMAPGSSRNLCSGGSPMKIWKTEQARTPADPITWGQLFYQFAACYPSLPAI